MPYRTRHYPFSLEENVLPSTRRKLRWLLLPLLPVVGPLVIVASLAAIGLIWVFEDESVGYITKTVFCGLVEDFKRWGRR